MGVNHKMKNDKHQPIMIGADLSRYNYEDVNPSSLQFVWLKASEGKSYKDPTMDKYISDMSKQCNGDVPFIGFYHYARPENNTPEEEAEHYLKTIKPHLGNCLMALDWEGNSLKEDPKWAVAWLNYVYNKTGVKPLFYTGSYASKSLKVVADAGYELWLAHYVSRGVKEPTFHNWSDFRFWQFTSTPFDIDIFKGTKADMAAIIQGLK